MDFMGTNELFCGNNPRLIEHKIIEFINVLRERGLAFHTISNYVYSIMAFYKINDIVLNTTKIGKFLPEERKIKKDRGYTHNEIHQLLDFVDERYRVIVLILSSTGIRIGSLPELRLTFRED
jgi:integrase